MDRIRYDEYKTRINDMKYLKAMPIRERRKILSELKGLPLKDDKRDIRGDLGLRFDTYISPDGANIWYSVGGNPKSERTLVFLHGIGINSRDWRHQITFFEKDYRIIAIDLRGFGKSQGLGKRPPHIRNYAEDVEGVLTKEGIKDAILIGHSLGGIVALNMDELYGDMPIEKRRVNGLVLIASTAGDPTESFIFSGIKGISFRQVLRFFLFYISQFEAVWNNRLFKHFAKSPLFRSFVRMIFERLIIKKETHPLYTEKVIGSVFMNDLQDLIYGFRALMSHDVSDRLKDLAIPVLWIIGEGDLMVRARYQEEYARMIKDCKVVKIPEAFHYPHATYPRRVNKEIYMFINSGTYRFTQLVKERIKEEISLDELYAELKSIKLRYIPRLDFSEDGIRLIDEISSVVMPIGKETGVSDEVMIKAVIIIASQLIKTRKSVTIPPAGPMPYEELEEQYRYVVQSV